MNRSSTAGAIALLAIAVLLPPHGLAAALAGADSPLKARVALGVWLFKAMLLVHSGLLALSARMPLTAPGIESDRPSATTGPAVLILLLVAGTALRVYHLGEGLWFDEIQTLVDYARLPLGRIVTTFDSQNQHLLYSVLARGSIDLFGESTWSLRLPAALLGVLTLLAVFQLGSRVAGRRQALLATALLTFSYHHVWFSQDARGYSGLLLWTLLSTLGFLGLLRSPDAGWGAAAAYGVWIALAVYTHVTALFVALAHGLLLLAVWWRSEWRLTPALRRATVGLLLGATFTLQLYALVLPQMATTLLTPTMGATATAWKNPLWFLTETLGGLARGFPGGWVSLAAGAAIAGAGLLAYARRDRLVTALFLLPAVLTAGAIVALHHNFWPRFFFFSAGFGALIVVAGGFALAGAILGSRGETVATALLGAVVAASALTVPRAWQPKQDYVGAAAYVEARRALADAVATVDLTDYPYQRYLGKPWTSLQSVADLEQLERQHLRTWVLYTFPIRLAAVQPEIWERLGAGYDTAAVFPGTVGGGDIVVMMSRSSSTAIGRTSGVPLTSSQHAGRLSAHSGRVGEAGAILHPRRPT